MGFGKSTFLFASGTAASRLTGLLRDRVVLGVFGDSVLLDAFIVANRIPNMFREFLSEGALGTLSPRFIAACVLKTQLEVGSSFSIPSTLQLVRLF